MRNGVVRRLCGTTRALDPDGNERPPLAKMPFDGASCIHYVFIMVQPPQPTPRYGFLEEVPHPFTPVLGSPNRVLPFRSLYHSR